MISKTTPYFYVIKHLQMGTRYCGQRRKTGCDPTELLTEHGYKTSSKTVKKLITEQGLHSFIIEEIITFNTGEEALKYESQFQQQNDCAASPEWFNGHNGHGLPDWLAAHKIQCCMQLEHVQRKQQLSTKKTVQEKYGVEYISQVPAVKMKMKESSKKTMQEKYGVDYNLQLPEVIEKSKTTRERNNLKKYGVKSTSQLQEVKDKKRASELKQLEQKYGVGITNVSQLESTQAKIKENCLQKYGVDHHAKTEEYKISSKQRMVSKYGVENPSQLEHNRKKSQERMKAMHEIAKANPITCPHCGKVSTSKSNMNRWHFDNCKKKP